MKRLPNIGDPLPNGRILLAARQVSPDDYIVLAAQFENTCPFVTWAWHRGDCECHSGHYHSEIGSAVRDYENR